jgi:hypothetical protein
LDRARIFLLWPMALPSMQIHVFRQSLTLIRWARRASKIMWRKSHLSTRIPCPF